MIPGPLLYKSGWHEDAMKQLKTIQSIQEERRIVDQCDFG
jgi:hypothetical protein